MRPPCSSAWVPRSRPGSASPASTPWRRRCCGSAASKRRTRRAGSRRTTSPTSTVSSTPSTDRSRTDAARSPVPMKQFKLPDVGEGLTEAEIVSWKVKPGDTVKVNEIVVEIETAKSLVELPSPFAGVVAELLVEEGTTVDVGTPIISVDDGSGGPAAAPAAPAAQPRDDMAP